MLSLWLRRLSTDRIARSRKASREASQAPLAVYGKRGNADVLVAVDDVAARYSLAAGLALTQARAMHPSLEAVPENTEADAQFLESIADWCLRYTPLIACDATDDLLLDITGCAHLYGGEAALIAAYLTVTGPASAAVRLLALDPIQVSAAIARLAGAIEGAAARGADAIAADDLPYPSAPALDLYAEAHTREEVRLFAS